MASAVVSVSPSGESEEVNDRTPVGARMSPSEKRAERDESSSPAGRRQRLRAVFSEMNVHAFVVVICLFVGFSHVITLSYVTTLSQSGLCQL
eukprot:TRINITY_DN63617_c0_g1_i1.p2 TRINITY_DN63617_c0_g1~~TRINITY_DN63617_c0_g1_i1.p2  ORF type:complete len:108 (-),score=14.41 TRINITY_DN63617_c0_g1_i1:270-545(-)